MLSLIYWWLFVFGSVTAVFYFLNKAASQEVKAQLFEYLLSKRGAVASLPAIADTLFERVFGQRHFSLRCILSSIAYSVIWVAVLYIIRFSLMLYSAKGNTSLFQAWNFVWEELRY